MNLMGILCSCLCGAADRLGFYEGFMKVHCFVARPMGGGGGMEKVKQPDTVFIQGLPLDVTQDQLKEHFGGIGMIKVFAVIFFVIVQAFGFFI